VHIHDDEKKEKHLVGDLEGALDGERVGFADVGDCDGLADVGEVDG